MVLGGPRKSYEVLGSPRKSWAARKTGVRGTGGGGAGTGDQEAGTGDQEAGRNMLRNLGVHAKTQALSRAFQDLLEFRARVDSWNFLNFCKILDFHYFV